MYYEINVAKLCNDGKTYSHYFATAKRSITSEDRLKNVLIHFKSLFPYPSYSISASYHPETGEGINISRLLNNSNSIWSEIRNDFEDEGIVYIDGYETEDENEGGITIAKINVSTKEVEYIDKRAATDVLAQEKINEILFNN